MISRTLVENKAGKDLETAATATPYGEKAMKVVNEKPNIRVWHLVKKLRQTYSSVQTFSMIKFFLHATKVQNAPIVARNGFCKLFLEKLVADMEFIGKLIMSDEAHFSLSGCVERLSLRLWVAGNGKKLMKTALHSASVTTGCCFTDNAMNRPFVSEDGNGKTT